MLSKIAHISLTSMPGHAPLVKLLCHRKLSATCTSTPKKEKTSGDPKQNKE